MGPNCIFGWGMRVSHTASHTASNPRGYKLGGLAGLLLSILLSTVAIILPREPVGEASACVSYITVTVKMCGMLFVAGCESGNIR